MIYDNDDFYIIQFYAGKDLMAEHLAVHLFEISKMYFLELLFMKSCLLRYGVSLDDVGAHGYPQRHNPSCPFAEFLLFPSLLPRQFAIHLQTLIKRSSLPLW